METIITTMLRTLLGFSVLFFLTSVLGKKQLSQMTFFTYITGIALGNIAGDMVVHRDIKLIDGVTGLTLWECRFRRRESRSALGTKNHSANHIWFVLDFLQKSGSSLLCDVKVHA